MSKNDKVTIHKVKAHVSEKGCAIYFEFKNQQPHSTKEAKWPSVFVDYAEDGSIIGVELLDYRP